MNQQKKVERVGLYFNLSIPSEAKMWEFLKDKKKSYELKKGLELLMNNTSASNTIVVNSKAEESPTNTPNISQSEVSNEGIGF